MVTTARVGAARLGAARATALAPRHLLTLDVLGPTGLRALIDLAHRAKRDPAAFRGRLAGGQVGLIFEKPSTRTRVSFEAAAWALGMLPISLRPDELQLGRGESIGVAERTRSTGMASSVSASSPTWPSPYPIAGRSGSRSG